MTVHPAIAAVPVAGSPNRGLMQQMLVARFIFVVAPDEDPQALDPVAPDTGSIALGLAWAGRVFWLDPDDSTTAHDGTTTLVTAGGERYKVTETAILVRSVLDKDLSEPPEEPDYGDSYIVATAATGDWATHDDEIMVWTARGWVPIAPRAGDLIYVEDEEKHYKFTAGGAWVAALDPAAQSVLASMINGGRTHWVIEDRTTNTPPSAAQGTAYIIGSAPTGAWVGHSGKIAVRETTGSSDIYAIYSPAEGWAAYDKALNVDVLYDGAAWQSASGAILGFPAPTFTAGTGDTTGISGGGGYTYSTTTAPTDGLSGMYDDVGITYSAHKTGAWLRLVYSADAAHSAPAGEWVMAVFRDSETNAIAWSRHNSETGTSTALFKAFAVQAPDTNAHTYTVAIVIVSGNRPSSFSRRLFTIEELAA